MDMILFILLYTLSLVPSYDTQPAQMVLTALLFTAWTLGRFAAYQMPQAKLVTGNQFGGVAAGLAYAGSCA